MSRSSALNIERICARSQEADITRANQLQRRDFGKRLRRVMEQVTIADVANSKLPRSVEKLTEDPGAWVTR